MREILFKAKTKVIAGYDYNNGKDDGEWGKGYLYDDIGCWEIRQFEFSRANYVSYEVDPETVCQYTGLTDKDGTKIWENDIVRVISEDDELFVIHWDKDTARYTIDSDTLSCDFDNFYSYELEVIGNIFDNPELLEVQNGEIN